MSKKVLLPLFIMLCFGIAKANMVKKPHPFFAPKTFTVYAINPLKNYETSFKFFPQKTFVYGPAPKAVAFQNKLMMENKNFECAFDHFDKLSDQRRRLFL